MVVCDAALTINHGRGRGREVIRREKGREGGRGEVILHFAKRGGSLLKTPHKSVTSSELY